MSADKIISKMIQDKLEADYLIPDTLDSLRNETEKLRETIGNLVELLFEYGIISLEDIKSL